MGQVRTDLELELEARETSVPGDLVGCVCCGHCEEMRADGDTSEGLMLVLALMVELELELEDARRLGQRAAD